VRRPIGVLAAAPYGVCRHEINNPNRRGPVVGVAAMVYENRCAESLRPEDVPARHAQCDAPPYLSPITNHHSPSNRSFDHHLVDIAAFDFGMPFGDSDHVEANSFIEG
jgi:hypothetical protein